MKRHSTLQGLDWLIAEVEASLALAYDAIDAFLKDQDTARLRPCLDHFHQVQGCLRLAECDSGTLLLVEMEAVVAGLLANPAANPGEACEVLVQAINCLPGHLGHLAAGGADHAAALIAVLNDLRAVRGERLFSESGIFMPALEAIAGEGRPVPVADEAGFRKLVKKLRQMYQAALLGLFRDPSDSHFSQLEKVCARLRELCAGSSREQLWRVAGAFVEGLFHHRIPWSVTTKALLRELDREVKLCADQGAGALAEVFPRALLINLLYYVALSRAETPRISAVRDDFQLDRALPDMAGPAGDAALDDGLVDAVARGLTQELESIKERVEDFIASERENIAALEQTLPVFKRIADTLAMVSQFPLRVASEDVAAYVESVLAAGADSAGLDKLATLIVDLEAAIGAWRFSGRPGLGEELPAAQRMEVNSAFRAMLEEVLRDIEVIKEAVLAYLKANRDPACLAATPALAARLATVLGLAGLDRVAAIMGACGRCLAERVVDAGADAAWADVDAVADVIMAVQHHLDDRLAGRSREDLSLLNHAELKLRHLGHGAGAPAPVSPAPPPRAEPAVTTVATPPSAEEPEAMAHDDVDPEIREIFVEEAREVLATLDEYFPQWAADPGNAAALTETRRAFHTLKGSGRMVGASDIGEFAWALESLLNRVIEGRVAPGPALLACLDESIAQLPAMVSAFEQASRQFDQGRVEVLRTLANRLGEGETVDLAALDAAPPVEGGGEEPDEDRVLLDIFAREASGHLAVVRQFVVAQEAKGPFYEYPTATLQSALHTLKGSAHMAGVDSLAELVTPLERFMREMLNFQVAVDADIVELLADCASYSDRIIAGQGAPDAQERAEFLARIVELRERAIGPSLGQGDDPQRAVDPAFLRLVMTDGMAAVLDVEATLQQWRDAPAPDTASLAALGHELVELEKGAARANLAPLATLAGQLAACYQGIVAKGLAGDEERVATLLAAHETLLGMVDAVAAHQELVPATGEQLDLLAALAAAPAPVSAGLAEAELAALLAQVALPEDMDADIVELFLGEADELLEAMEHDFQQWRESPADSAHPDSLKRSLHTFKGGARMAGLAALGEISHELESAVVHREAAIAAGETAAIATMLRYHDALVSGVDGVRKAFMALGRSAVEPAAADIAPVVDEAPPAEIGAPTPAPETLPSAEILPFTGTHRGLDPTGPTAIEQQVAAVQEMVKVAAPMLDMLVNLAGETSISRSQVEQHINEFMFSLDEMEATIRRMHDQVRRLGIETDAQVMFRREQIESSDSSEGFDPLEMDRYSQLQQLSRSLLESASDLQDLRDTLVDKARDAESLLLQQSRINTDLQEGLMRTRMVPFSRLVPRLRRIVRQVAGTLGKDVNLRLESIDGDLDRTILERIVPSLEHMIRNAVDHGIESEAERRALGKAAEGTLSLSLAREGSDVLIRLADDGRGLDVEAIRAKALSLGLLPEQAQLSDHDIQQFIFAPGFSTSSEVTQISGRGVGMDVVNSDVRQLGGSISINSQRGAGTEFTLRLPFTVSVNRALMIEVGEDSYALALNSIAGVTRIPIDDLTRFYQNPRERFEYGGEHYEVRYLGSLLSADLRPTLDTAMGRQLPVVLMRSEGRNYAVQVDGLIGSREIVVKTLGVQFSRVPGLSGATVLGDGRVVVILDLQALLRDQLTAAVLAPMVAAPVEEEDHIPTVMVVDDSVTVRKVTGRFLEREGFRVITAKDGVDAMRVLQDNTPDVMLLDIEMPRMDGFEVARLVRSTQRLRNLPIIMITSRTGEKHRDRALAMGVDHYLGKPYQEEVLMAAVRDMLGRGGPRRDAGQAG